MPGLIPITNSNIVKKLAHKAADRAVQLYKLPSIVKTKVRKALYESDESSLKESHRPFHILRPHKICEEKFDLAQKIKASKEYQGLVRDLKKHSIEYLIYRSKKHSPKIEYHAQGQEGVVYSYQLSNPPIKLAIKKYRTKHPIVMAPARILHHIPSNEASYCLNKLEKLVNNEKKRLGNHRFKKKVFIINLSKEELNEFTNKDLKSIADEAQKVYVIIDKTEVIKDPEKGSAQIKFTFSKCLHEELLPYTHESTKCSLKFGSQLGFKYYKHLAKLWNMTDPNSINILDTFNSNDRAICISIFEENNDPIKKIKNLMDSIDYKGITEIDLKGKTATEKTVDGLRKIVGAKCLKGFKLHSRSLIKSDYLNAVTNLFDAYVRFLKPNLRRESSRNNSISGITYLHTEPNTEQNAQGQNIYFEIVNYYFWGQLENTLKHSSIKLRKEILKELAHLFIIEKLYYDKQVNNPTVFKQNDPLGYPFIQPEIRPYQIEQLDMVAPMLKAEIKNNRVDFCRLKKDIFKEFNNKQEYGPHIKDKLRIYLKMIFD